jgi:fucose 4-O-acetylase-like acetyltransferase
VTSNNRRIKWIDIAKGIGITAVVLGHSGNPFLSQYIYWFHMPLFFIISGYLHKQPDSPDMLAKNIGKKSRGLLIPYVSFYFLIFLVNKVITGQPPAIAIKDFFPLIWGGQLLVSAFAPFWFITVLYLTQLSFSVLLLKVKNKKTLFVIIFSSYVLSYFDSLLSVSGHDIKFMWDADVVLLAVVYYGAGYLLRTNKIVLDRKSLTLCSLIACTAVALDSLGLMDYSLNMRSSRYNHFLLDLLIPIAISMMVLYFSRMIEKYSVGSGLANVGRYSLQIMCLHLTVNIIADHFVPRNFLFVTLIGIIIPILFSKFIFEKTKLTRFLFLGALPDRENQDYNRAAQNHFV